MRCMAFMVVFIPLILILPARIVDLLLPFYYGRVSDFITTILLVIMLAISMFLLWRYLQNMQLKITTRKRKPMSYEMIHTEIRNRVGLITLNRPKALNALNNQLMGEVMDALEDFDRQEDSRRHGDHRE